MCRQDVYKSLSRRNSFEDCCLCVRFGSEVQSVGNVWRSIVDLERPVLNFKKKVQIRTLYALTFCASPATKRLSPRFYWLATIKRRYERLPITPILIRKFANFRHVERILIPRKRYHLRFRPSIGRLLDFWTLKECQRMPEVRSSAELLLNFRSAIGDLCKSDLWVTQTFLLKCFLLE